MILQRHTAKQLEGRRKKTVEKRAIMFITMLFAHLLPVFDQQLVFLIEAAHVNDMASHERQTSF